MSANRDCDVLIVGGGVAGLACAVALADRGLRPVVIERAPRAGGRAASWVDRVTGDTVDIGPHVLHSEYRIFTALLERLGTAGDVTWQPERLITLATEPRATVIRHAPLPPPLSLLPGFARMPGLSAKDLASNSRATWRALAFGEEDVPALDAVAALDFLRASGATEPMIDRFWRFASMAVMNTPLERCSAAALLRVHSQLIGHRGLHFGFPAIGLGALFVPGATRVVTQAGGRVLLDACVSRLEHAPQAHCAVLEDGTRIAGPRCVLALPPSELAALHPGAFEAECFEPSPYRSVYAWFDRRIAAERFWALPWSRDRLNYDFYDLTLIRPSMAGRGSVVASNVIYSHRAHAMSDEALVAATVDEIALFAPDARRARLAHAVVHRIPMAVCCPTPGTESRRPGTRTRIPGVYLAGDWLATALPSSMESAARSGFMAAEAVLADEGRAQSIAVPPRPNDGLAWLVRSFGRIARRRTATLH